MFWGLIMEPNKRYTQIVEKAFHVSMATLDVTTADDEIVQVMLCYENRNYLLCNLKKGSHWQNSLDLNFKEGTKIAFTSNGRGHVHLTGYLLADDELDDYDEAEEEEEEDEDEEEEEVEDVPQLVSKQTKRKAQKSPPETKSTKRMKALVDSIEASDENSDDEDDDDSDAEAEDASLEVEDDDSEEDDEDAEEEEEDTDEDEEDESEKVIPPSKKNKQQAQQAQQKQQQQQQPKQKNQKDQKLQNSLTNGKDAKAKPVDKKAEQTSLNNSQAQKKRVLTGGVQVEDLKVGNGAVAKQGKFVSVYYIGKLKNGKKFDATTNGDGFKFRLGKGEVIKGWDIGVQGMKVGGKRRITIPPGLAYGAKGSPPVIPGNSTLTFEVELKNVN